MNNSQLPIIAILIIWLTATGQNPPTQANTYVGDSQCRKCHPSIFQTYRNVSMSQSFQRIDASAPIEDWANKNRLYHKPSNQYFVMTARDGRFYQRRYQIDASGQETNSFEMEIDFAIGSGKHERDYIHRSESGEFLQLPVVWYAAEKRWGMAPGYDRPDHDGFSRRVNYRCVFCHAGYPEVSAGADRSESQISLFPQHMPEGVNCERCHGPGERHAANPTAGSIVNPAKLDRKLQMDVCLQCHLETTSASLPNSVLKLGRGIFSFRPGEPLEDYAAYFDYPAGSGHEDDFNIVHQGYRLRKSQCFAKSSMTCLTCHDPHRVTQSPGTFYNAKCSTCHSMDVQKHGENCVACHMPKRRTDDIVHVIMTDHDIQRRPPKNLLSPKAETPRTPYRGALSFYLPEADPDLYMGLALARGAGIRRGADLLERVTAKIASPSAELLFQLGAAYAALGDMDRAARAYAQGLQIDPRHSEARFNMAIALMNSGKTKEAATALRLAISEKPQMADAYVALGTIEIKTGDANAARTQYQQALRADPQNTLALDNLGLLETELGKFSEARKYFELALRVRPDDPVAKQNLKK